MGNFNQLYGETGTLDSTAVTASATGDSMEMYRTALNTVVAGMRAGWDGLAPPMFESAHANWEAGIMRLITALHEIGDNTRAVSVSYTATDDTVAANLGAVANGAASGGASGGAFGNALVV